MFKIIKLDFLVAVYIFCIMASELMGGKTFPLAKIGTFQLNASVAIFLIPIVFSINDIVTEVFGKERARSIVRSGLVMIFLVMVTSLAFTALPPSTRFFQSEAAYDSVFGVSARIAAASLVAFTLAEFLDVYIFAKIRERLGTSKLWLRNNLSNFISQFVDTSVFMVLAFYAVNRPFGENVIFLVGLILPYWLLKCSMSIIETPLVYLGVRWLKSEKNAK